MGIRFGLCCLFQDVNIKFRTTTATACQRLSKKQRLAKLSALCMSNATALHAAYEYCAKHGIGCFRINSHILPCKTHPVVGYQVDDLPQGIEIIERFQRCGNFARQHGLRASFHPDQFVVLNSPRPDVVEKSIEELEYQSEVAQWVGADVVNIHGGGGYGDKPSALDRFSRGLGKLSARVRERLTVENDDRVYTPRELLPVCRQEGVPLVYDVHHHRCLADEMTVAAATHEALKTWKREPMFHISSPKEGWKGARPERHHDYINVRDFPVEWFGMNITVEVEAKAKEQAVFKLQKSLLRRR